MSVYLGHCKVCYTRYNFLVQLVSQRRCKTSARRIVTCGSAFNVLCQASRGDTCERYMLFFSLPLYNQHMYRTSRWTVQIKLLQSFHKYNFAALFTLAHLSMIFLLLTDMTERLRIKDTTWYLRNSPVNIHHRKFP